MFERVKEIITEQLNLEGVEITESSSFKEDLNADSLDLFELVMAFEEEYGIEIPSEDLEKISTVGDLMEYMKSKGVE
ncbi:MAG TPA: acyl carrier protein [Candidatus Acetatifactor stercoripullorum]|uniref:Acyl carrier protein n=1 Tax=Candidatus Acetatifactor stercoripullorum TaxID=2838414 RepID=A0A9D1UB84_9FIRM|nr:acyl carrier protein [Candidatus Acetatifactor stercoripullorum]HIW80878.1 acyl carrier protein [Candidatus Acetatifactor stercoripullorum]